MQPFVDIHDSKIDNPDDLLSIGLVQDVIGDPYLPALAVPHFRKQPVEHRSEIAATELPSVDEVASLDR